MHFIQIGEWIFDSKAQQLSRAQQNIQLEPISSALLYYLCQNCERIVTRDDLICRVWNNRVVSDSAINRVISMLRKHLGDDRQKPNYIRTVHKQGYLLLASVRELSEQDSLIHQHKSPKGFIRPLSFQNILVLFLFCITGWLSIDNIINSQQLEIEASSIAITPIVTDKGQEVFVALSPNDEFIVYSHTSENGGFYHLYHKELKSGKVVRLTRGSYNDFGSSIDVHNQMVYFVRLDPGKSCLVMRLNLLSYGNTEPESIQECNKSLNFNSVAIHPNNNDVFYIDDINGWYVYRFNMQTKEKVRVSNIEQAPVMDYFLKLSPDGTKLVILRLVNSVVQVVLKKLNQLNYERVIWRSNGAPMISASWSKDSDRISFIERRHNQLISYDLNSDSASAHVLKDNRFNSLSNQKDNGEVFAVVGNQTQYDISSIPIDIEPQGQYDLVIASTANDKRAIQVNKQDTFYVSDRSGMFQFWRRDGEGVEQQLSSFNENRAYSNFVTAPNGKYVVGLTDGRLFRFTLSNGSFEWLTDIETHASHPMFSPEGVLHYIVKGKENLLMRYKVQGKDTAIISGAVFAEYFNGNILYQDTNEDIYSFDEETGSATLLFKGLIYASQLRKWVSTENGIYFIKSGNGADRGLYFQSFDTTRPVLILSGEPNPFGSLSYDRFNQRILFETEEDIDTNIVNLRFNEPSINEE